MLVIGGGAGGVVTLIALITLILIDAVGFLICVRPAFSSAGIVIIDAVFVIAVAFVVMLAAAAISAIT